MKKTKKKAGRPSEKTPEVIRKIEEIAALDGTVEEMAFFAGIHRATLYRWLEDDKELSDRIEALRQEPVLLARRTVVSAIKESPGIAMSYLERKKKNEFSPRQEVDHSVPKGFSLKITADDEPNPMATDEEAGGGVAVPN